MAGDERADDVVGNPGVGVAACLDVHGSEGSMGGG